MHARGAALVYIYIPKIAGIQEHEYLLLYYWLMQPTKKMLNCHQTLSSCEGKVWIMETRIGDIKMMDAVNC